MRPRKPNDDKNQDQTIGFDRDTVVEEKTSKKVFNDADRIETAKNVEAGLAYVYEGQSCKEWHSILSDKNANPDDLYRAACKLLKILPEELQSLSADEQKTALKKAYRQLSMTEHPDKRSFSGRSEAEATAVFKLINEAKVLLDQFVEKEFRLGESEEMRAGKDLADMLRRHREAMAASAPVNPNPEPPSTNASFDVEERERLATYIEEAKKLLSSTELQASDKAKLHFWLMSAAQAQSGSEMRQRISEFESWKLSRPAPSSPAASAPGASQSQPVEKDSRETVLGLLLAEQKRLMDTYHIDSAGNYKGITNLVKIGTKKNGEPYYKDNNKTAGIAMDRICAIGDVAKKLRDSMDKHPSGDNKMNSQAIYQELQGLREKMKGTGMGFVVTGRTNITRAMETVAPEKSAKAGLVERIRNRFR